jgi:NADPH2:quinone reductase
VGTGREASTLRALRDLGASATIDLKQPDAEICESFKRESGDGYDVILDFLWGHPAELLFRALTPSSAGFAKRRTRYVQIGEAAGSAITLLAEALRTSGLELIGAGSVPTEVFSQAMDLIWGWMREEKLTIDIVRVRLRDIAEAWDRKAAGQRIVIVP